MDEISITPANEADREWAALLMARSEPWMRMGKTLDDCCRSFTYSEELLFIARQAGTACGFLLLRPRGVASAAYIVRVAVDERYRGAEPGSDQPTGYRFPAGRLSSTGPQESFIRVYSDGSQSQNAKQPPISASLAAMSHSEALSRPSIRD